TDATLNEGGRPGTEVVQVYGGASGTPPRLVGFARVDVPAGTSVPVQVRVAPGAFARRPVGAGGWVTAVGPHDLVVARHAEDPDARRVTVDLRP
ncbi:MAG: fibronectin type III-like domain-contianing protein, partial [Acidimicrobiales bacterium]